MIKTLIGPGDLCRLADIERRRFNKRRERQNAAADIATSLGGSDFVELPVTPSDAGLHGRFDAYDAVRLRAVVELERAGLDFGAACRFVRGAGIGPEVMFPSSQDMFAAQWILPGGVVRRVCGDARDLARAMPEAPIAAITINLSATRDDIAKRAVAQLGLAVVGTNFARNEL